MEPAGRVDVAYRDREDEPPGDRQEPSPPSFASAGRPASDDVIAVVDRLEERLEVRLGQGLLGGRHQNQRESSTLESRGQGAAEASVHDRNDSRLHLPAHLPEPIGQGRDD